MIEWFLTIVVALIFLGYGTKLLFTGHHSHTYEQFANYGLLKWMTLIGFWEITVGILFFLKRTSRLGYLLAMMNWGGMFLLQLSYGQSIALVLLLMIFTSGVSYIRNPQMLRWSGDTAEIDNTTEKGKRTRPQWHPS